MTQPTAHRSRVVGFGEHLRISSNVNSVGSTERLGPRFFPMTLNMLSTNILRALLSAMTVVIATLSVSLACATEASYRVSGIIVTPEKRIAVVEKSDGSQQLYKQGESIDGFIVEKIDHDGIFLTRESVEIFLELEGKPTRLEDVAAATRTRDLKVSAGNATQSVDYDRAQRELEKISAAQMYSDIELQTDTRDGRAGAVQATLEERLNMALGLPSNTQIRAVNSESVSKPEHALMMLAYTVGRRESVRLEVGGSIPGVNVLYLTPQESPSQ